MMIKNYQISRMNDEGTIYQISKYQVLFLPNSGTLIFTSNQTLRTNTYNQPKNPPKIIQHDIFHLTADIQPMFHEVPNVKSSNMAGGKGSNGPSGDWWTSSWSGEAEDLI